MSFIHHFNQTMINSMTCYSLELDGGNKAFCWGCYQMLGPACEKVMWRPSRKRLDLCGRGPELVAQVWADSSVVQHFFLYVVVIRDS